MLGARDFVEVLASGRIGVTWSLPTTWRLGQRLPDAVQAEDQAHGVLWSVSYLYPSMDLDPRHIEALWADVDREARNTFERFWAERTPEPEAEPRIVDPSWSPVIDFQLCEVGAATALWLVRRDTYAPGDERIQGSLSIPLAQGTLFVSAYAEASTTGVREKLWTQMLLASGMSTDDIAALPDRQRRIDDPALDDRLPRHPLSLVRRALAWVQTEAGLRIDDPAQPLASSTIALSRPGCAIVPPPRYLPTSELDPGLAPTQAILRRITLPPLMAETLEVVRLADTRVLSDKALEQLESLARADSEAWGGRHVQAEVTRRSAYDGRSCVDLRASYASRLGPEQRSLGRWFADRDGAGFRICLHTGAHQSWDQIAALIEQVYASCKRLDVA